MSMMQICQSCGLQPLPGARFCRQCGAPLFRENDETKARTRTYGGSVAAPRVGYAESASGSEPIDTARFYQAPASLTYSVPHPTGSSSNFWLVIVILCALAGAGVIGSLYLNARINRMRPNEAIAQQVQERIAERQAEIAARQAERQAEQMARQAEKQAELAARMAERAARGVIPPVPPVPPVAAGPLTNSPAEKLIYPGAEVESNQRLPGSQILRLRSSDSLDQIRKYYQESLGQPPVASSGKTLVYTKKESGSELVVTVKPHPQDAGEFQIQIIQTR